MWFVTTLSGILTELQRIRAIAEVIRKGLAEKEVETQSDQSVCFPSY